MGYGRKIAYARIGLVLSNNNYTSNSFSPGLRQTCQQPN